MNSSTVPQPIVIQYENGDELLHTAENAYVCAVPTCPCRADAVGDIIFTGYTEAGDELVEWQDESVMPAQHEVYLDRSARALPEIIFSFSTQASAHALFLALCDARRIFVEGE